jgi:peptidoglycan/LPS O-acetylase OafA/YrhL
MLHHCYPEYLRWLGEPGWIGVDLFFCLSGYLITGILLNTVEGPHYYRNFIGRRTIRIFPLYYACLVCFSVITVILSGREGMVRWGGAGWFFCYLGNVRAAWVGMLPPVFVFVPLWSLQVEEQFYLFYPAVIRFMGSGNRLRVLLAACVVSAPLIRVALFLISPGNVAARYALTPCRMDALALGGLVAIVERSPRERWLSKVVVSRAAVLGLLTVVALLTVAARLGQGLSWDSAVMSTVGYSATAGTSALVLALVVLWPSSALPRALCRRPLIYTGQIAYGLYLLHGPASWGARTIAGHLLGMNIRGHSTLSVPLTFLAGFALASLSWKFFEAPILSLKNRFTR